MPELEDLLTPISEAAPCGEDMSFSTEFDVIQEARRADDPSLEQGEWITDLKSADWPAVSTKCAQLLQQRSKDLRLAGWWAEAEAQTRSFAGLADGYRLVAGLCDRYWGQVHPLAEDGDEEQRIGNLGWLLGNSIAWLRALPLVDAAQGRFGLGDFEAAHARRGDEDDNAPTLEMLEAARRGTSHEFYMALMAAVPDCRQALAALEQSVDARLQHDGPSFSAVRDQLNHLHDTVLRFARDAGVLVEGGAAVAEGGVGSDSMTAAMGGNGPLGSRKEALAQLRRVAEFFRRTEPHSPVAYLADKAARWGEMPLHVWLKRVIKDDTALSQIEELLDIDEARPGE